MALDGAAAASKDKKKKKKKMKMIITSVQPDGGDEMVDYGADVK